ncbi:MAG: FecR domain-containing protein [Bacteroidota bacterium]
MSHPMEEANTYWDLIAKYLRGETSTEEKESLYTWVNQRPENRELFNQLNNLWNATGWSASRWESTLEESADASGFEPDVDRAWLRFQSQANLDSNNTLTSAGITELKPEPRVIPINSSRAMMDEENTSSGRASSGRVVSGTPWHRTFTRIAATILLVLGAIFWVKFYFSDSQPLMLTQTALETKRVVYLPDSSKVYLNKHSELKYATGFSDGKRVVNLIGEAFFEVRKDAGKPFVIYSQNAQTEVLGTSFNVRAYPQEARVQVLVVTGKVAFSAREGQINAAATPTKVYLTPGTQGELTAKNTLTQSAIKDPNGMAWKNEKLSFNNTPLPQVAAALERYFEVKVQVDSPQLLKCRFTGSYENPDIQEILKVLKVSLNLSYTTEKDMYILSGEGCP